MISFLQFKEIVKSEHGIWESPHVRFSRTQSEYSARYQPLYPETSIEDEEIHLIAPDGIWTHRAERIRQAAEAAAPGDVLMAIAAAREKCQGASLC